MGGELLDFERLFERIGERLLRKTQNVTFIP